MQNDNLSNYGRPSYQEFSKETLSSGAILREVGKSVKDLIQSEVHLLKTELKESIKKVAGDFIQAVAFGALLALSTFPFLAFLVIGLGEILNNNYWLSSLVVAIFCASIGGFFAVRAWKKIQDKDLTFPQSRKSFARGARTVEQKLSEIKEAATGGKYEDNRSHVH